MGIWLIFIISGDYKEKKRQEQRMIAAPIRHPPAPARPAAAPVARPRAAPSSLRSATPPALDSPDAASAGIEKSASLDQWQGLSVSAIRETFERFRREL
jgi:hypothetical protein